ncbi:MAG: hypothetical protein K1X89_11185 [Myxococcaceae bacterium]|nr:hypothetical protein [Myxococcaceae bacterium]
MRVSLLLALLPGVALADVGPKPPPCNVPAACTTCWTLFGDPDAGVQCGLAARDAGLVLSDCADRVGASEKTYYCPPGMPATQRPCGCDAGAGATALGAVLVLLWRRARSR